MTGLQDFNAPNLNTPFIFIKIKIGTLDITDLQDFIQPNLDTQFIFIIIKIKTLDIFLHTI